MRDELRFAAPLAVLGLVAERMFLRTYLAGFLKERNRLIKQVAEGPKEIWSRYTEE